MLPSDTLATLQAFLSDQAALQNEFEALDGAAGQSQNTVSENGSTAARSALSLADYRRLFAEDWQQSQFWYSDEFALSLSEVIRQLAKERYNKTKEKVHIAFIACPTTFCAYQVCLILPDADIWLMPV